MKSEMSVFSFGIFPEQPRAASDDLHYAVDLADGFLAVATNDDLYKTADDDEDPLYHKRQYGSLESSVKLGDKTSSSTRVYVADLDRPWRVYEAFKDIEGKVDILRVDQSCKNILLVVDQQRLIILNAKQHFLNCWDVQHSIKWPSQRKIICASWLTGLQNFVTPLSQNAPNGPSATTSQNQKFDCGAIILDADGRIEVVLVRADSSPSESRNSVVTLPCSLNGINHIKHACVEFEESRKMILIAALIEGQSDLSLFAVEVDSNQNGSGVHLVTRNLELPTIADVVHMEWLPGKSALMCCMVNDDASEAKLQIWKYEINEGDNADSRTVPGNPTLQWTNVSSLILSDFIPTKLVISKNRSSNVSGISVVVQSAGNAVLPVRVSSDLSSIEAAAAVDVDSSQLFRRRGRKLKRAAVEKRKLSTLSIQGSLLYSADSRCGIDVHEISSRVSAGKETEDPELGIISEDDLDSSRSRSLRSLNPKELNKHLSRVDQLLQESQESERQDRVSSLLQTKVYLLEALHGRRQSVLVLQQILLNVFLAYLEQFVSPEDEDAPSLFQVPEIKESINNPEIKLEETVTTLEMKLRFEKSPLHELEGAFHFAVTEIIETLLHVLRYPECIGAIKDLIVQIRLILAMIKVWTSDSKQQHLFWPRPLFYPAAHIDVLEVLFVAFGQLLQASSEEFSTSKIKDMLDERGIYPMNLSYDWKKAYILAESRSQFLAPSAGFREFICPDESFERSKLPVVKNLKLVNRKRCTKCLFEVPWREEVVDSGTWHSHMQQRWKGCFCGGSWVLVQ